MLSPKIARLDSRPVTRIEKITPEKAWKYLEANTHNRPLNDRHVDGLVEQMKDGTFRFNGDTIRIDRNGRLLDGQHRLEAIIKANMAFDMIIVSNLEPEVFTSIDTGRKRLASDVLSMEGLGNSTTLSAAARLVFTSQLSPEWNGEMQSKNTVTNEQILRTVEEHPDLLGYANRVHLAEFRIIKKFFGPSISAFAMYWLHSINDEEAESFFHGVELGEGLNRNDPEMLVRNRIMSGEEFLKSNGSTRIRKMKMALLFKAWNMRRENRKGSLLRWKPSEQFPTPK